MKKIVFWLYRINLLILLFWGAHAWPLWFLDAAEFNSSVSIGYILLSLIIAVLYSNLYGIRVANIRTVSVVFVLLMCFFHMYKGLVTFALLLQYIPLVVMMQDKKNASSHLNFIVKVLAVILVPGILIHIYGLVAGLPPSIPLEHPFSDRYLFFNYFFYIADVSAMMQGKSRFCSIFLEPAFLATICVGLLYANEFKFKKRENLILLIGLILTFSLLGYICFFAAYVYYLYSTGSHKNIVPRFLLFFALLGMGYVFAITYNNGKNMVNNSIVERLAPDEEKGIAGYNRNSEIVDNIYYDMMLSGELLSGIGSARLASYFPNEDVTGNAGWKLFVVTHGIICSILFFIVYLIVGPFQFRNARNKYAWGFVICCILDFISLGVPHSWMVLLPMALGLCSYKYAHSVRKSNEHLLSFK